jgi:hypothetical protein
MVRMVGKCQIYEHYPAELTKLWHFTHAFTTDKYHHLPPQKAPSALRASPPNTTGNFCMNIQTPYVVFGGDREGAGSQLYFKHTPCTSSTHIREIELTGSWWDDLERLGGVMQPKTKSVTVPPG